MIIEEVFQHIISITFCLAFIILLGILYANSEGFRSKGISKNILYSALTFKILGTFGFCYVYANSIEGDTIYYHESASLISNLFWENPIEFFKVWFFKDHSLWSDAIYNSSEISNILKFNKDSSVLTMIQFTVPFELLTMGDFYGCSLLISFLAFTGIWKIYELLTQLFTRDKRILMFILFLPSVLFWTGGILKDTFIIAAICWMVYSTYNFFVLRQYKLIYFLIIALCFFFIIMLKPYVLVVLIPSLVLWVSLEFVKRVEGRSLKALVRPIYVIVSILIVVFIMTLIQRELGVYGKYDSLIDYSELVRGGFDATSKGKLINQVDFSSNSSVGSGLETIFSILYRPFIWESWNDFSFLVGVENACLLIISFLSVFLILFDLRSIMIFFREPLLIFCLMYSLLFAFGIGLSVSNFGAIVRFKSAFLPFMLIPILVLFSTVLRRLKAMG